jgi:glycerol-3-phosphate acyltransferase PlsY
MMWLLLIPAYLLGTFPSAVMVARSRGIDITKVGSGNPGASNVSRTMGRAWGIAVFVLDALKGIIPAAVGAYLLESRPLGFAMVAASILGHMFPITRRLQGGKGVATMAGSMFVLQPLVALILFFVWFAVLKLSKKSSIASLALIVGLPVLCGIKGVPAWEILAMVGINALLLMRHTENIKRLVRGTELSASRSK